MPTQPEGAIDVPERTTNKESRRKQLAALALRVKCPRCGAMPGESCETESGEPAAPHAERRRFAIYKPVSQ